MRPPFHARHAIGASNHAKARQPSGAGGSSGIAGRTEFALLTDNGQVGGRWSGRQALAPMMKTADLRQLYDPARLWWLDGSWLRRVLARRQMRSGAVAVGKVRGHDST